MRIPCREIPHHIHPTAVVPLYIKFVSFFSPFRYLPLLTISQSRTLRRKFSDICRCFGTDSVRASAHQQKTSMFEGKIFDANIDNFRFVLGGVGEFLHSNSNSYGTVRDCCLSVCGWGTKKQKEKQEYNNFWSTTVVGFPRIDSNFDQESNIAFKNRSWKNSPLGYGEYVTSSILKRR